MRRILATLTISLPLFLTAGGTPQDPPFDILLRGGTIVDGTGGPPYTADLGIREGRIAVIGNLTGSAAEVEVDAVGMVVTPGFIDAHAHGDPRRTPDFPNVLAMGVTTLVLGQDGSSHVDPADPDRWFEEIASLATGPNIAYMAGHAGLRQEAGVPMGRAAEGDELDAMEESAARMMRAGCYGLSTGLEYRPGTFASRAELAAMARGVGRYDGVVMSHVRDEDDPEIEDSFRELIDQGRDGGVAVHVSHIKAVYGHGSARAERILGLLEAARGQGVQITADIYPYLASYTGISILFPDWALPPNDFQQVVRTRRPELEEYLRERVASRNGPEATLLGTRPWAGKTLAEVAEGLGLPFEEVLIDEIGPGGAGAAYFVMDRELQDRLLVDPHVMIASDGSPTMRHPRGYGTFARVIRRYVVEERALPLEEAVRKMTGLPARTLGLDRQQRGLLREGWVADVLVFDPGQVADRATFEEPHVPALGFDEVIVGGRQVISDGRPTGSAPGRVLRRR